MRLPEGASIAPATRADLEYIFAHPRPFDAEHLARLGEYSIDTILESGSAQVVSLHGEPVLYFHASVLPGTNIVMYGAGATPVVDRFPVTFTRCARSLLRETISNLPDHFHMTVVSPGMINHAWLKLLGFKDTDQFLPGRRIQWMVAHIPSALIS